MGGDALRDYRFNKRYAEQVTFDLLAQIDKRLGLVKQIPDVIAARKLTETLKNHLTKGVF